ncbi:MAG: branched-chain amino acid aminotransferase [Promethearchaeota archaeon]
MKIEIIKATNLKKIPKDYSKLRFGKNFTDHMLIMEYKESQGGWGPAKIIPYGNLSLDPAASVLHYGQEIFEGMKCYTHEDGSLALFRPDMNFKRMNNSADKMCMPNLDIDYILNALKELLKLEKAWVPNMKGTALYIRPTMIASQPFLGVHSATEYLFYIILSPVGAYFKNGFKPVKISVETKHVRACPGGIGDAKTGGNYAASLKASTVAEEEGFSQVLWLDAIERKYIAEIGAMNVAFVINDEIITPELDGSILPGITRNSVITICKHKKIKITERKISIDEVIQAAKDGSLTEAFGMGTAAVIAPIGSIYYQSEEYLINDFKVGPKTQLLFDEITGIQSGIIKDEFGWIEKV